MAEACGRGAGAVGAPGIADGIGIPELDAVSTGGLGAAGAGMGCRGPERICPGRGAGGMGRAGIAGIALVGRGAIRVAWPLASGGRNG